MDMGRFIEAKDHARPEYAYQHKAKGLKIMNFFLYLYSWELIVLLLFSDFYDSGHLTLKA